MYSKILVPVDGSDSSKLGLLEAIKVAKIHHSEMCLIHVVNELVMDYAIGTMMYSGELIEALRTAGKDILAKSEAVVVQQGIKPKTVLIEAIGGPAATPIIAQAKEWQADLIVMGTHGRRGIRRMAMGSDAELVLRHAPVPVLVVRNTSHQE